MEGWHQGRSFTACGKIATAKISNHIHFAQLGQQCRGADLYAEAGLRVMAYGLAVAADRSYLAGGYSLLAQQLVDVFGGQARPLLAGQSGAAYFIRAGLAQCKEIITQ